MITLLTVVLMILGDEPQVKPTSVVQADADRPAIAASEIKALRDSNIFAPYGPKRKPPSSFSKSSKSEPVAAPKPKAPVVTGIFFDAKMKCYLVVVEDRNEASLRQFKDPKFLKSGEEVVGLKVGPVTAEKATFLKGEIAKELSVGDALPAELKATAAAATSDDPEAAPSDGEEKVDIKPLDTEEKNKVLDKMKKERGKKNRPSNDDQETRGKD
jgi:hypothetical protein